MPSAYQRRECVLVIVIWRLRGLLWALRAVRSRASWQASCLASSFHRPGRPSQRVAAFAPGQ